MIQNIRLTIRPNQDSSRVLDFKESASGIKVHICKDMHPPKPIVDSTSRG